MKCWIRTFNVSNLFYRTALMAAGANGQKEVLELLIQNGASLDLTTETDLNCINNEHCTDILTHGVK